MPLPSIRGAWLALLLLAGCAGTPPRPAVAAPAPDAPVLLLISIDGLHPDALGRGDTPHLDRIAAEGVRAEWMNPSYPVLTFPNHFTLVTGLRPDRHGIVHNTMRDAGLGEFRVADREAGARAPWWQGEPIWNAAEQAGLRTAIWAWPGNTAPIGGLRPTRWVPYSPEVTAAARADEVAGWVTAPAATRPRLAALYFEHVDAAGHDHGPDAEPTRAALRAVDAAIGRILKALDAHGLAPHTDLIVVSDHGMAPVEPEQYLAVEDMAPLEEAEAVSIGQVIGFNPRPGREQAAAARLLGRHAHHECWRRQDLPPRWRYGSHPRVPAIVCQMDEGWNASPRAHLQRIPLERRKRGAHGYDPALPSMRAMFVARGPSFRSGVTVPAIDNVDVYPLLARLLGVEPAPNDGDPRALLPALKPAADAPAH